MISSEFNTWDLKACWISWWDIPSALVQSRDGPEHAGRSGRPSVLPEGQAEHLFADLRKGTISCRHLEITPRRSYCLEARLELLNTTVGTASSTSLLFAQHPGIQICRSEGIDPVKILLALPSQKLAKIKDRIDHGRRISRLHPAVFLPLTLKAGSGMWATSSSAGPGDDIYELGKKTPIGRGNVITISHDRRVLEIRIRPLVKGKMGNRQG